MTEVRILPVPGIGEIVAGDDLAEVIGAALAGADLSLRDGDILCVTSKVVSKACDLVAATTDKRAAVAAETVRVVAERMTATGPTRIVEGRHGVVMAGAGVDASNTGPDERLLLLPHDPDAAAAELLQSLTAYLRSRLGQAPTIGLVLSDTAGRPWRGGQTDFALGAAGLSVLSDYRGRVDADGRPMEVTAIAVADEIAAASDLVKGKVDRVPAAIVRGLAHLVAHGEPDEPGAARLIRTGPGDFFAMGHVEAARAALGVPPGSQAAATAGIRSVGSEPLALRVERALRVALDADPAGPSRVATEMSPGAEPETLCVTLLAADPYAVGRALARLEVALWSEGLRWESLPREPGASGGTARVAVRPGEG